MKLKHFIAMLFAGVALAWTVDFGQSLSAEGFGRGLHRGEAWLVVMIAVAVGWIQQRIVRHINALDLIIPATAVVAVTLRNFNGWHSIEAGALTLLPWMGAYVLSFRDHS